ncbi:MAG: protein kinase, partial [Oscillospiraceae bacterium]
MDSTYQILQVIGQGSGGVVYKALHTRLNKEVVIKQIKSAAKQTLANRTEVDLLKGLKHTYLPQVLDFIEENGEAYTVMDFVDGADVDKLVKSGRRFRQKEVIGYGIQLCEAVEYLHRQKRPIIHSDIKPGNLMINSDGNICLIDFNVSLVFDGSAQVLGGTMGYAPPEQLGVPLSSIGRTGDKPAIGTSRMYVDERSDIYSIGATLYFMLTGTKPANNYCVTPISSMGIPVSDGLLHVINKAMALNPSKRYKSVSEMLSALENIGKLDKRYRALKLRREIVMVLAILMMAGGLYVNRMGAQKLSEEHEEKYSEYLEQIEKYSDDGDYTEADEYISLAINMEPSRLSPYYSRLLNMQAKGELEKCVTYPDSVINADIQGNSYNDDGMKANMYMIAAESAFMLEQYSDAIDLYRKSLFYAEENPDAYRDLTISYARTGDTDNAESTLEKAKDAGVSNDQLYLMEGEIDYSKGKFAEAFEIFCDTVNSTDNHYIKYRALLIADEMVRKNPDSVKDSCFTLSTLLDSTRKTIDTQYAGTLTEMLANQYVLCGNHTKDNSYYAKAVQCYFSLNKDGNLSYTLKKNCINILYAKLADYDKCLELLKEMENEQPEDYWVWMNYSYTYSAIENKVT